MRPSIHALVLAAFATSFAAACGSTPGARPHDMAAAQHEAAAASEERTAQLHSAQYDPGATVEKQRCGGGVSGKIAGIADPCWTSTVNPTAEHNEAADRHRQMAADHRAASRALRDAEARACVGISDAARDESPFAHREDIVGVERLTTTRTSPRPQFSRTAGAVITFRAVPGMTAQWLQRVVDCHLARNAALGHDVPEMAYCPLVPNGVSADVEQVESGFAVSVSAEDPATAVEVLRRARALVGK